MGSTSTTPTKDDAMSTPASTADRLEIADLFTRWARLLDERRWGDAGTVFAEEVQVDSPRIRVRGIDELVDYLRRSEVDGEHTQHTTTDLLARIDGDRAAAEANSLVYYYRDGRPPHRSAGLRQSCTAVRTSAGWRLSEIRVTPAWIRTE
ncbi:nuclear transport factor 2 family protein [Nocardia asteroides]|uniref:nuclear transport factor 2 family protein n=1 Tax=Nocardia asteroides TaxID=1824 RepID=UPI001E469CDD|nr:nuclear transport factor 2 family protein [Nocardia asteroides]UGT62736.1 nuclear transport factor 2 family protein [Nocardia asteroides]